MYFMTKHSLFFKNKLKKLKSQIRHLDKGIIGSCENYQAFNKMVLYFRNLKSDIFTFVNVISAVLDPDPYPQYGSGSSGDIQYGSTWIWIRNTGNSHQALNIMVNTVLVQHEISDFNSLLNAILSFVDPESVFLIRIHIQIQGSEINKNPQRSGSNTQILVFESLSFANLM